MTNRQYLLAFTLFSLLLCCDTLLLQAQGVTTASLNGRITSSNKEGLIGATIVATHGPSGSKYGVATDLDGFYRIPSMRVGGPYVLEISYTGFEPHVREGIFLTLGQGFQYNVQLQETAIELDGVEVVASRTDIFDGNRTGQESIVDERIISDIPTVNRAIADYARFNPLASIEENNDGFTISLAGQNNRYNAIYIDGAVNNDAFGLAGSGTNGGQTGVQPISIDAIEQFTIAVAPFDVRQSGFAGGTINAVTRSGTNNVEGSAYYFLRNESLSGLDPRRPSFDRYNTEVGGDRSAYRDSFQLADFTATTYGFRLGGPIIQNKLFFFINGEIQRDETPKPFLFQDYNGDADRAKVDEFVNTLKNEYNYDPGTFEQNAAILNSDKVLAKLDWNVNNQHKVSLRHSYVWAEELEARSSSPFGLRFENGSEYFISTTHSSALEVKSLFSNTVSNHLTIGATFVRDDRDPFGDPFPTISIEDGNAGGITLGAESFSTANLLNQDIITVNNNLNIYKGRHNFLFGLNFEYFNAGNLFIPRNFGSYTWEDATDANGLPITGLQRFLNGDRADQYQVGFSQVDELTGDESAAIAKFKQMLAGLYVQDEIQVNDRLKLTAGIRVDVPIWPTDQPINQAFNDETIAKIEAEGYDLLGAQTGTFIDPQFAFSPRVGFNYDLSGDRRTQLRGGAGMFTSRIPLVWPGGAYNNYGFNIGSYSAENVAFVGDVNKQNKGPQFNLENPVPLGDIDLFAADFKLPQALKINVALDHKLPFGIIATVEGLYTKLLNQIYYQNLNLKAATRKVTAGPDDRPLWQGIDIGFGDDPVEPNYVYIMLAQNTNKGYTYNLSATLTKLFSNGFSAYLAYSYGDAYQVLDGTSSQNKSQWRGYHHVPGRNFISDVQRSRFAAGHRIFGQAAYEKTYAGFGRSKLSFNFNAQTGGFFSYVIGESNFRFVDDGGFSNNELIYVPETIDEAFLVDTEVDGVVLSPADQWAILNSYIVNDPHLKDRRGQYAQRNGGRIPMRFSIDLRFLQDFYVEVGNGKRNTLQLSVDIFNFTNLLNRRWGRRLFAGSFGNYPLIFMENDLSGNNDTTPKYTVNRNILRGEDPWDDSIDDTGFRSSRWQMQVGIRYIFGQAN